MRVECPLEVSLVYAVTYVTTELILMKLHPGNQGKQGHLSLASRAHAQQTRLTPLAQLARLSK